MNGGVTKTKIMSSSLVQLFLHFLAMYLTMATQPELEYLKGVHRLNNAGYSDFYFCCNVAGRLLQWQYNNVQLGSFVVGDAGRVIVGERSGFEYTVTLLSSRHALDNSQEALMDSILMVSFHNDTPGEFEITCSSGIHFNSTRVQTGVDNVKNSSGNHNGVSLDYIVSRQILKNNTKVTHIFVCGTSEMQQFFEVEGPLIAFSGNDHIGQSRTVWSADRSIANVQGVLIARQPYTSTSILIVSENSDVTVTCYFGTNEVHLTSNLVTSMSTPQLPSPSASSDALTSSSTIAATVTPVSSDSPSDFLASSYMLPSKEKVLRSVRSTRGSNQVDLSVVLPVIIVITAAAITVTVIIVLVIVIMWRKRSERYNPKQCAQAETPPNEDKRRSTASSKNDDVDDSERTESDFLLEDSASSSYSELGPATFEWETENCQPGCGRSIFYPMTDKECPSRPTCSSFSEIEEDVGKVFVSSAGVVHIGGGLRHRTRTTVEETEYVQPTITNYTTKKDKSFPKNTVNMFDAEEECDISPEEKPQPITTDLSVEHFYKSIGETIADFGMSGDEADYYTSSGGKIPIKWTAPEAIHYSKYSAAIDVWSYGCVLFEILSLGHKPFKGVGNVEGEFACQKFMGPVWRDKLKHVINSTTRVLDTYKSPIPMDMLLSGTHSSMFQTFRIADEVTLMRELSNLGGVMDSVGFDVENSLMSAWCAKFLDAPMSGIQNLQFFNALFQEPPMKCTPETSKDVNLTLLEVLEIMKDDFQARQAMQLLCDLDACSWKENKAMYRISPASQLTQR